MLLNRRKLRKNIRALRKELRNEWTKLTSNDLHKIEDELDHIVELFEQRYGYNSEQALEELERYIEQYGTRTRTALTEQVTKLQKEPKRALPYIWGAMSVVGLFMLARRFLPSARR